MRKSASIVKTPAPSTGPTLHVQNISFGSDLLTRAQSKWPTNKASPSVRTELGGTAPSRKKGSPAKAAPVAAGQHGQRQTERVVLEALAFPTEGCASIQTDTFLLAPLPPSELLLKTGIDAATSTTDLFDFESEVRSLGEGLSLVQQPAPAGQLSATVAT
jgi:hypothetical protein